MPIFSQRATFSKPLYLVVTTRDPEEPYLIVLAVLVMLLVGVSRVYLGVHWPIDVLAGWTVGIAWALMIWLIALWLQQRGEIERED